MRYVSANPATELVLPCYEKRLAERIVGEDDVRRLVETDANRAIGCCYDCFMPLDCGFRRHAGYLAQCAAERGHRPDYGVRKERPDAIHRPDCAAMVEIDGTPGKCEHRGAGFPVQEWSLDRGRVRVNLRRAAKRAGVADNVSPHWLRHAHASHALDRGAPIHLVQAKLGHSSVPHTPAGDQIRRQRTRFRIRLRGQCLPGRGFDHSTNLGPTTTVRLSR
jgi:hypothetical protein